MKGIIETKTKHGVIKFYCPGGHTPKRANTLLTKETETIEWINTFKKGDILWDIGANVGCYSLYAGLKGFLALAFEPAFNNYDILNRNIYINKLDKLITAYCIAFHNKNIVAKFNMRSIVNGMSLHCFADNIGQREERFVPEFCQGMIGYSIDKFIQEFNPIFPNHIKIDVDGNEDKILTGAIKTISDKRIKSMLVEITPGYKNSYKKEYEKTILDTLKNAGLVFSHKKMPNYIFVRK